jgi:hypothetical protein
VTSVGQKVRATPATDRGIRGEGHNYQLALLVGLAAVTTYLAVFFAVLTRAPYDTWAGLIIAPILLGIGLLVLGRMLPQVEDDRWIQLAIKVGLGVKLLGGFARYLTNEYVLGRGDAYGYYVAGSAISEEFRDLVFGGPAFELYVSDFTGTRFIRLVTALPYVVTGPTQLGGYIIFSFLSFWGLYLFYRAHSIAFPGGLRRRYVVFVFFLPSVVFWPSSIGKEAWLTTMLGLGTYGLARLLTQQRFGYVTILASMVGMGVVRPHVAAIFVVATAGAFMLRRSTGRGGTSRKIAGILVLAIVVGFVMNQVQAYFGIDNPLDAQAVFDETTRRSSQGGSQFDAVQPTSITNVPWAVITVLFRPFLFEAGSVAGLVTAVEGTILLALFIWNAPRLARLPRMMIQHPFIGYAMIYSLVFAFSFSAIGNFGILARQRTQLFPVVTILLTIPMERSGRILRGPRVAPVGRLSILVDGPAPAEEPAPRYRNLSYDRAGPGQSPSASPADEPDPPIGQERSEAQRSSPSN